MAVHPTRPDSAPFSPLPETGFARLKRLVLGRARDVRDPSLTHKISLVAFLAWVGLGVDGLTSSAYGPEEAFRGLGSATFLAPALALATAMTVLIISYSYSRIIEQFPSGGGGYMVATQLLGRSAGVVSGCALLVDYVLTIAVSIAGGGNAVFSMLPPEWHTYKLPAEIVAIGLLIVMNLRGVKESVTLLVPFFLVFFAAHAVLILGGIGADATRLPQVASETAAGWRDGIAQVGVWGVMAIFLRAYSMGAGTYTGIEAVSNGMGIMREPRIETGKRTMAYMAGSLALLAGGLLVCYMLAGVTPDPTKSKTLNAILAEHFAGNWRCGGLPIGVWFVWIVMLSEGVLLVVAAQTGFIGGPRVMANMAAESWLPRRFVALSDRLSMQNGVLLMGVAALATLVYARGNIEILVVMYSINVFVTFSLSQLGMCRFWVQRRSEDARWTHHLAVHGVGLVLCMSILCVMLVEKLSHGGWVTLAITGACIVACTAILRHYRQTARLIEEADKVFVNARFPSRKDRMAPWDPGKPTAIVLVTRYGGLGIHPFLTIFRLFPETFHNVVFASVGVVDSRVFAGPAGVQAVEERTRRMLERYTDLADRLGIPSKVVYGLGADVVEEAARLCVEAAKGHPRAVVFGGELCFEEPKWYHRILHNDVAYAIQRRLRSTGLAMVILPYLLRKPNGRAAGNG